MAKKKLPQIVQSNKYCIYFHFGLEHNNLFYVGYGVKKRSYDNNSRSKDWKCMVDINNGYYVEIFENRYDLPLQEALDWEVYFIKKYGRNGIDNLGILVNKSVGGLYGAEGSTHSQPESLKEKLKRVHAGKILSQDTKDKISDARKGMKFTEEHKNNIRNSKLGCKYDTSRTSKISSAQKGKPKNNAKPIMQYNLDGNFVKEWRSISEAKLVVNNNKGDGIGNCCRGNQETAYGYRWSFKNKL
jgi:hypothetical protein